MDKKRIGIICAMEEELNEVNLVLDHTKTIAGGYFGETDDFEVYSLLSGIGKVNAAMYTQWLIDTYNVDYVINVGIAGGLADEYNFGDIVVATDLVQYDVDVTAFGDKLGQIPRMDTFAFKPNEKIIHSIKGIKFKTGRIVSGDTFVDDKQKALFLRDNFDAVACEMEGAAVAHVCHVNKVPFAVVRSLSDKAGADDKSSATSFEYLKLMAAQNAASVVSVILENL